MPPSPDKYDLPRTFGNSGLNKSFAGPDNYENVRLKKQAMMPGPGNYGFPDMIRKSQNVSELLKYTYTLDSRNRNPMTQKWSKANDRFKIPKDRIN